jgi:hypothetical protein
MLIPRGDAMSTLKLPLFLLALGGLMTACSSAADSDSAVEQDADTDADADTDTDADADSDTDADVAWQGFEYFGLDISTTGTDGTTFNAAQCFYDTVGDVSANLCEDCVWAYDIGHSLNSADTYDPYGYCEKYFDPFFDGLVWTYGFHPDYGFEYNGKMYYYDIMMLYYRGEWGLHGVGYYYGDAFNYIAIYANNDPDVVPGYYYTELLYGYANF